MFNPDFAKKIIDLWGRFAAVGCEFKLLSEKTHEEWYDENPFHAFKIVENEKEQE